MSLNRGLRRKIWVAFILQATAISFAAVLGVYAASAVLKHVLIQRALTEEAGHYWKRLDADRNAAVPDTFNMTGYLVRVPADRAALPAALRGLAPGYHALSREHGAALVLVEQRDSDRLYLLFKQEQVDALAFWFGMAPLVLVLVVVYVIAWSTYRASRQAVSPVIWLASQVERWDAKHPDVSALKPENLPRDVEDETLILASSLHDFGQRIEQLVERERQFTRDASHELRTPVAVVRMAAEMMAADEAATPRQQKALKRVLGAASDMESLIESFLILAREGDTGLPSQRFPISDLLQEEMQRAAPLVASRPIELRLQVDEDFEVEAPSRVVSITIGNLLRNACRYTDSGTITLLAKGHEVWVEDTGIGMDADQLARVFEPFWRGDIQREGQGIGLSIVQRLAQRYGWKVILTSEPGVGTRAGIRFPAV